jgi:thiol-disulfide isomerase/thioredoxin
LSYNIYGVIFLIVFLVQALLLPQPSYKGPQYILYFRDAKTFKEEIAKDNTVWLVEFYTAWNPACVNFASVFAELSAKYNLENLKFGKVDLARFPEIGEDFRISDSAFSKQLPTIILFKGGKPAMFRPNWDSKGKLLTFHMNFDNIVTTFGLNDLYKECKEDLKKRNSKSVKNQSHPKSE